MSLTVRRLFLLSLTCLVFSCRNAYESPAEKTYREFVEHVQVGKYAAAFAMLSDSTQKQLSKRPETLKKVSGEWVENDVAAMTFSTGFPPGQIKALRVVEDKASHIILAVSVGGKEERQKLVIENGQWKIDWSSLLPE